ncbi:MAG: Carboxylesterase type [Bacteroidetes bacterium]|nr:Carboxylesterase type [Bacteroidota bacterium]
MTKKVPLLVVLARFCYQAFSQVDCSGGRYYADIFPAVTVYSGLVYGQNTNVSGSSQTLKLDFYKPTGDTVKHRPVMILAFGGSFVFGTRQSPDIVQLCNAFTKKGYVCAAIDYRLGLSPGGLSITSDNVKKAIWRVTHDMRAAVRWMRMNAAVDSLGIDTSRIIVGGVSAGGFGALHCAYLDQESEIPAVMDTATEGGIEGNSGNPGYSSRPWAVVNLCGALLDTGWIQAGDPPIVTMQGDKDGSVPYCTGEEEVFGNPISGLVVAGGNPIEKRVWGLGNPTGFYTWWGADHTPFILGLQTAAYMDTTIWYVRDFLSHQLCASAFSYSRDSVTEAACNPRSSGIGEQGASHLQVYPIPAHSYLQVHTDARMTSAQIIDMSGRVVVSAGVNHVIPLTGLSDGMYFVQLKDDHGNCYSKRFIKD